MNLSAEMSLVIRGLTKVNKLTAVESLSRSIGGEKSSGEDGQAKS